MAYSGKFKPNNPKKYAGDYTKIVFRSMWEKHCFKWCDNNPNIRSWSSEEVIIPYYYDADKKYHRYFPDLKIVFTSGQILLVEIKPDKETRPPSGQKRTKRYINEAFTYVKNMNKWEAAQEYSKDRGWEFQIWTENTLQTMGIMPKPLKKLKPLPAPKKRKK